MKLPKWSSQSSPPIDSKVAGSSHDGKSSPEEAARAAESPGDGSGGRRRGARGKGRGVRLSPAALREENKQLQAKLVGVEQRLKGDRRRRRRCLSWKLELLRRKVRRWVVVELRKWIDIVAAEWRRKFILALLAIVMGLMGACALKVVERVSGMKGFPAGWIGEKPKP